MNVLKILTNCGFLVTVVGVFLEISHVMPLWGHWLCLFFSLFLGVYMTMKVVQHWNDEEEFSMSMLLSLAAWTLASSYMTYTEALFVKQGATLQPYIKWFVFVAVGWFFVLFLREAWFMIKPLCKKDD